MPIDPEEIGQPANDRRADNIKDKANFYHFTLFNVACGEHNRVRWSGDRKVSPSLLQQK